MSDTHEVKLKRREYPQLHIGYIPYLNNSLTRAMIKIMNLPANDIVRKTFLESYLPNATIILTKPITLNGRQVK